MKIIKTLIGLSFIGMALGAAPILSIDKQTNEGVFICEDNGESGPIFYPASYSSSFNNEPNYSTQNSYTFSLMNFNSNVYDSYRGESVKVAVIDSGLNYDHEDFIDEEGNQIIKGQSRTIDNSSGSWLYYQFSNGWASKIDDTLGHGTNVAACIASQINEVGGAGVAPNVELYVYKVTNSNNGYEWTAIQSALNYCVNEGIDVVNMSFQAYEHDVTYGGSTMEASSGCSSALSYYLNKCYNAGIVMVAAAGNYNTAERSYPASNNHVISVGSLAKGSTTTKAAYSNLSDIDLVAPGSVYVADKGNNDAYKETQGTSFSSPIVTAAIALYKQKYPNATVDEITDALLSSCSPIDGNPSWAGHGRLNVEAFLNEETISVDEVSLSTNALCFDLKYATSASLSASISPNDATTKTLKWTSSNSSVASVSSTGVVTAKKVGTATIKATAASGVYDECTVTVTDSTVYVSSLSFPRDREELSIGDTLQLNCAISPSNAENKNLTWTSSDETVATVNNNGLVTPLKSGSTTVTAQSVNNKTASVIVTVYNSGNRAEEIILSENEVELTPGETYQIEWMIGPETASQEVYFELYENNNVISVSEDGLITAIKRGTEIITVYSVDNPEVNDIIEVTVKPITSSVTDSLNRATTGITGTSYSNWSGKSGTSGAVYAGQSAGGNSSIQLRDTSPSGIVSTTSGGKIKKVILDWNSSSTSGRTINVYASNTAFANASGTYLNNSSLIGTIVYGTTTELAITGDYAYVGIKSNSGALYLNSVSFVWQSEVKTLLDIELSGTTRTTFYQGESFSSAGLVVTASYDDSTSSEVTPTSISTPDLTVLGKQDVTVTYTENGITKTKTYEIEVLEDGLISISASCSKSFHPGETITNNDITVTGTYLSGNKSITDFDFGNYMFRYEDTLSGGAVSSKGFAIVYNDLEAFFSVNVSRTAYSAPTGTTKITLTSSAVFNNIGGSNASNDQKTGTVDYGGTTYYYNNAYYYGNGKAISLGNSTIYNSKHGYIKNNTPFTSAISSMVVSESTSGVTPNITYSEDGITFEAKTSAQLTNGSYYYFRIDYENSNNGLASSKYSNITKIEINLKNQDNVNNVCNYIMYEDNDGQCVSKLDVAISRLNNMSESDKTSFMNSENYVITKARERIEAWARNQRKEFVLNVSSQFVLQSPVGFIEEKVQSSTFVAIICGIGVLSSTILFVAIKKKKLK